MMVNGLDDDEIVVALQIDHSRVAGYLAANWGNAEFARLEPYESMVLAAQEHDNGWWDWEVAPTMSEEGMPLDYIGSIAHLGDGVWLDLARKGAARLEGIDLYAALMTRMHAEGLLTQAMGLIPRMMDQRKVAGVEAFLEEGEEVRARWRAELAADPAWAPYVTEQVLWTNYKYLEVFDQLAQYVCNRYPFDSAARSNGPTADLSNTPVPVRPGVEDVTISVDILDDHRAVVTPYPFGTEPLPVAFPARVLPNRPFTDRSDFLAAFYSARRIGVEYLLLPPEHA